MTSPTPSRRVLLASAVGGLGALAASAIGRPGTALAVDPNDVVLGALNTETATTQITNTTNTEIVFWASSTTGTAVYGTGGSGIGVSATSTSNHAVYGYNSSTNSAAVAGWCSGGMTGVEGYSTTGGKSSLPAPKARTGVYGYAAQDSTSKGVYGESPTGFGGYFAGKVFTTKWYEMGEITAPGAPAVNQGRIFMRNNALGKTELCVRFNTGAIQVIATQP